MKISQRQHRTTRLRAAAGVGGVGLVAALATLGPSPLSAQHLTFATLNIAYATHASLAEIAAVIRSVDADVVALQEVDRFTRRRPVDQASELGRLLDMEVAYAPAIAYQSGEFGIALLTRLPLVTFASTELPLLDYHSLPLPTRLLFGCRRGDIEQRLLLMARIRLSPGAEIGVATTHLGLCGAAERLPQAGAIAAGAGEAALLAGDFNTRPTGAVANAMLGAGWQLLVADGVDWIVSRSCISIDEVLPRQPRVSDHPLLAARVRVDPACLAS